MIYLDSSALVKLAVAERETEALRAWLDEHSAIPRLTSEIARVEVARAVMRSQPTALLQAREVIARLHHIVLGSTTLDTAAALQPPTLRSLDAIHLASALVLGHRLTAFVVYDRQLVASANELGLPVATPGRIEKG